MKMEKINDNQIKCILSLDDLNTRNIKISELAYGSDKARGLFFDMMQKARRELDFDFTTAPIMVEAIPSSDFLTLIITKVTNAEELDSRFSRFSQAPPSGGQERVPTAADSLLNLLKKIGEPDSVSITVEKDGQTLGKSNAPSLPEALSQLFGLAAKEKEKSASDTPNVIQAYRFESLDECIKAAQIVSVPEECVNSLYKYEDHAYILIIHSTGASAEDFNRLCNILVEYGIPEEISDITEVYLKEHDCCILSANALQALRTL